MYRFSRNDYGLQLFLDIKIFQQFINIELDFYTATSTFAKYNLLRFVNYDLCSFVFPKF